MKLRRKFLQLRAPTMKGFVQNRAKCSSKGRAKEFAKDFNGQVEEADEMLNDAETDLRNRTAQEKLCDLISAAEARILADAARHRSTSTFNAERILALAMARHPRLGSMSAARILTKDILRYIFSMLNSEHLIIVGGIQTTSGGHGHFLWDPPFSMLMGKPLRDVWRLNLISGAWTSLPSLPIAIANPSVCLRGEEELWVMGGYRKVSSKDSTLVGNVDAFVFSFRRWRWLHLKCFLDDGFGRSAAAIHIQELSKGTPWTKVDDYSCTKSDDGYALLLVCGGGSGEQRSTRASPDLALLVPPFSRWETFANEQGVVSDKDVWDTVKDLRLPKRLGTDTEKRARIFPLGGPFLAVITMGWCRTRKIDKWNSMQVDSPDLCCSSLHILDTRDVTSGWKRLPFLRPKLHLFRDASVWMQGTELHCAYGSRCVINCSCCGPDREPNPNHLWMDFKDIGAGWKDPVGDREDPRPFAPICFRSVHELDGNATVVLGGIEDRTVFEIEEPYGERHESPVPVRKIFIDCGGPDRQIPLTEFGDHFDEFSDVPGFRHQFGSIVQNV